MVSLSHCVHDVALPLQILFETVLGKAVPVQFMEDNEACIVAVRKGYSPSLCALSRTQRVHLGFLHDVIFDEDSLVEGGNRELLKVETALHKGDMFTKELEPQKFIKALSMLGMTDSTQKPTVK